MKKHMLDFLSRGLLGMGFGPIVMAIVYGILGACDLVDVLSVDEVVRGILTISLMAFIAAGITSIYQIDRLPLPPAILLHGAALYLDYLIVYLVNGWLALSSTAFWIFTACFFAGYAVVWIFIWLGIRSTTARLNRHIRASKD